MAGVPADTFTGAVITTLLMAVSSLMPPARRCTAEIGRTARQQLVRAQRLRTLLTYAVPHFAVQARIELTRADLALSDLAGPERCCERSMSCSGGGQTSAP